MRSLLRGIAVSLLGLLAMLAAYLFLALCLGAIAVNRDFAPAGEGVPIYVRTNGVHAEFILPARVAGFDWTEDFPSTDMRALVEPHDWIAFGWGDRDFFASTPTWRDLRPMTALVALSGVGDGAMHVEYVETPLAYLAREVRLNAEQYARLVAYIRGSFVRDTAGRPQRLALRGYFATDAFYAAESNYAFWFTCNDWVRRGLTAAGVRAPLWSPFDVAIFHQLEKFEQVTR